MTETVPTSVQPDTCLASTQELGLPLLARGRISEYDNSFASSMIDNNEILPVCLYRHPENVIDITQLRKWIEEADTRIVADVARNISHGCERAIVLSNDLLVQTPTLQQPIQGY